MGPLPEELQQVALGVLEHHEFPGAEPPGLEGGLALVEEAPESHSEGGAAGEPDPHQRLAHQGAPFGHLPQAEVVDVAAGGEEGEPGFRVLADRQAEQVAIKRQHAVQPGDRNRDMGHQGAHGGEVGGAGSVHRDLRVRVAP